jgi:hypothetical protein
MRTVNGSIGEIKFGEIELGVRSEEINRRARRERRDKTINSQRTLRSQR